MLFFSVQDPPYNFAIEKYVARVFKQKTKGNDLSITSDRFLFYFFSQRNFFTFTLETHR